MSLIKMIRQIVFVVLLVVSFLGRATADTTNSLPPFEEVYKLLRKNLGGVTENQLDNAAVRGLLSELKSHVSIASNSTNATATFDTNLLSKAIVYDKSYVYLRIGQVADGLGEKLIKQYQD